MKNIDTTSLLRHLTTLRLWSRHAVRGQGLVEYAAILGFVAALVVVSLIFLQPQISTTLNSVTNGFH